MVGRGGFWACLIGTDGWDEMRWGGYDVRCGIRYDMISIMRVRGGERTR